MTKNKQHGSKLKVGIYDRWLHTLGGGEQVAFAYAETFRDWGYETEILTHRKFDADLAEKKMQVSLKGIKIRYIPNLVDYQLSQFTEDYDIFVSNSYLDYIPNRSKFGILSIFFPSRVKLSVFEYLKRAHIVPSLRKLFIYPSEFIGFKYDELIEGKIFKWLGKESTIYFNKNIKELVMELHFEYLAFSCIDQIVFKLGAEVISPTNRRVNPKKNSVAYEFRFPMETKDKGLTILLPKSEYSDGVALTSISIRHYQYTFYNLFKSFFPSWEMRLHGGPSVTKLSDITSYDALVSISKFTQHWVHDYWGIKSEVLFPPVNIQSFANSTKKKNIIANVGRFFVGGHSKKQLDMLRVFKRMVDGGVKDWELHLVGGLAPGYAHAQYLQTIKEEAEGYPVVLHIDAPFNELKTVLSEAKIYWHATGLDENVKRYPVRLEHFGITTVEAMAAGCVPVVINCGGQPEIVKGGYGILWNTREQLLESTKMLIEHPVLLSTYREKALARSKDFSREVFRSTLKNLLIRHKQWV